MQLHKNSVNRKRTFSRSAAQRTYQAPPKQLIENREEQKYEEDKERKKSKILEKI